MADLFNDFIAIDKAVNHKVLGGHWNQTVSRNVGSRIGRATGIGTDAGTDLFHGFLVLGGLALGAVVVGAATGSSRR